MLEYELEGCLPAIVCPRTIGNDTWSRFSHSVKTADLGSLETLDLTVISDLDNKDALTILLEIDPGFLRRCRVLKKLHVNTILSFKWAVDERLAWNRYNQSTNVASARETIPGSGRILPPIPLEHISFSTPNGHDGDFRDAIFAFGDTLKGLNVNLTRPRSLLENHLGQGLRLPELRTLRIYQLSQARLFIDPELMYPVLGDKLRDLHFLMTRVSTTAMRSPTAHLFPVEFYSQGGQL
ncbi:hypothetical protein BGZ83_009254 [Gryganskiella cystojenkinii]|nr:hypothetical protein BGZ83_009254 [Gryganskiella cystojenkinii]